MDNGTENRKGTCTLHCNRFHNHGSCFFLLCRLFALYSLLLTQQCHFPLCWTNKGLSYFILKLYNNLSYVTLKCKPVPAGCWLVLFVISDHLNNDHHHSRRPQPSFQIWLPQRGMWFKGHVAFLCLSPTSFYFYPSRLLLCNLVRVKLGCYKLEGKSSPSLEDYLKAFMETEVKLLWPKGWMQARYVVLVGIHWNTCSIVCLQLAV